MAPGARGADRGGIAVAVRACTSRRRTAEREGSELVEGVRGLPAVLGEATGAERAQVYANLGLRLDNDPYLRRDMATADLSRLARMGALYSLAAETADIGH